MMSPDPQPLPDRRSERHAGVSLLETLVGLTILAFVLLLGLSLIWLQPAAQRRLQAHGEALRAVESVLESYRAGLSVPLDQQLVTATGMLPAAGTAEDLQIWVEPEAEIQRGLRRVTVRVRYAVDGRYFERQVVTRVWRP